MDRARVEAGQQILRWIEKQGEVFYTGRREREKAKLYLRDMQKVFPALVGSLSAIYLYRQAEQPTQDGRERDGVEWTDVTPNLGTLYAIGISTEALEFGQLYTRSLFLHECTHIIVPEFEKTHGSLFDEVYLALRSHYERVTGVQVPNCDDLLKARR